MRHTQIAGRPIPVREGDVHVVEFSAGRLGKSEAGLFEFWTAVAKRQAVTARSRVGGDPGERFRRMEKSAADANGWKIAYAAEVVRPATKEEVIDWLDNKPDGAYAEWLHIGSKRAKVVKGAQGVRIEY